jgi:hypothetical protein
MLFKGWKPGLGSHTAHPSSIPTEFTPRERREDPGGRNLIGLLVSVSPRAADNIIVSLM